MQSVDNRIEELGIVLPAVFPVPEAMSAYMAMVRIDGERCFVSGHAPLNQDGSIAQPLGKVGSDLTIGMLAAILHAQRTGEGDVVDAAMVDGTAHMMNLVLSLRSSGNVRNERGKSILDGPHWFDTYACSDGKFISVGALEPHFYQLLLEKIGLADDPRFAKQYSVESWPELKQAFTELFAGKTQQQWCEILEGTDACFAPVLNPDQAAEHPHMQARDIYFENNEHLQAHAAPRFSKAQNKSPENAKTTSANGIIREWQSDQ